MVTCGGIPQDTKPCDVAFSVSPASTSFRGHSPPTGIVSGLDALALSVCYVDEEGENGEGDELQDLIAVSVPDSVKIEWSNNSSFFASPAAEKPSKDYSMVIGVHKDGTQLSVWVFSFELTVSESPADTVQLYRKTTVNLPGPRLLSISSVPQLELFEIAFASFDTNSQLKLWTFADLDDLLVVKMVHTVDVANLMQTAIRARKSTDQLHFHVAEEQLTFKHFSFSSCGRVAILFEEDEGDASTEAASSAADDQICFLPALESCLEGVVTVPHKQFGRVLSLEWTPPVTPERDCDLLFLSTTTIGMLKFDCLLPRNKWSIAWSSSRFSARPEKISSLSSYPYGLLAVGPSLAHLNLRDIDGSDSSALPLSLVSLAVARSGSILGSQPPSKALPAHHPITLMYLLSRGSFQTIEKILDHAMARIVEHEEACYLRMADDTRLRTLPVFSLAKLLRDPSSSENDGDERSDVYLRGKSTKTGGGGSGSTTSSAPARASNLFAMDFGASRRYGASANSGGGADRADMLFAPQGQQVNSADTPLSSQSSGHTESKLETDVFSRFFSDHKSSLSFMSPQETEIFLAIVGGLKKTLAWERASSRQKDEAALRFHASLLWPVEPSTESVDESKQSRLVGLCSEQVAWGAVSDFQSELLQECFPESTMTWKEMKRLRLPFWLKSSSKLTQLAEKAAQAEFAATRDPFTVAVFYVLLGKTRLLASLFKMANETRIFELLGNDFSELRWKNAAIKNAYVLKTKQRYELSAAFFLLGGKVQEAVSVAEQADETLVLSFLIARVSEKWDIGGQDGSASNTGAADFSQASFTGLSTSLRGFAGTPARNADYLSNAESSSDATTVCVDFLNNTIWTRACDRGDVYMCFLVKYFLGEMNSAIDVLITPPVVEMDSIFGTGQNSEIYPYSMYWSAFGESLVGACDLVRFLRKTIVPMKLALKEKIVRLNTTALLRMQGMGLTVAALIQQRDTAAFVQEFRRECATSADTAAFLSCRQRILTAAVGRQVDFLYATFLKSMRDAMTSASSSTSNARFDLEERLNEEIECAIRRGGDFSLPGVPETSREHVEHTVRASVVESLVHTGRLAALDFLMSGWNQSLDSSESEFAFSSPLPRFIEVITEGVAVVASGDLVSAATDYLHTRKVDQTCSELLAMAVRLLLWLQYFYSKPVNRRSTMPSREFVRVAVAAVYSVICICTRYLKSPCCLYRVLGLIFPHKEALPAKAIEALNEIADADVCVNCAALQRPTMAAPSVLGSSSLQQDIPLLYQVVRMLEVELDEFTASVKTSRMRHAKTSADLPMPPFSYCSYWTMVLMMAASAMPAHLSKIAGDGTPAAVGMTKKLVEAWDGYTSNLAGFATKHLLCDLAGFFFRPFSVSQAPASEATTPTPASGTGMPRVTSSPNRLGSGNTVINGTSGSPRSGPAGLPSSPPSPQNVDRGDRRQLLKCECARCPWLLLVKLFADKNELLLRLNAQLECCSEKIDEEVRWGRLPEPASRKAALTRSQKLLLSSVAEKASSSSRAADLTNQLKRSMVSIPAAAVHVQCVYRSETNIKAMCFNRAAGEDAEVSVCSSKGIFRASCMDYADGSRFQFKGMYAAPQATSFFSSEPSQVSPLRARQTTDSTNLSSNPELVPTLTIVSGRMVNGPPSPLRHSPHLHSSPS
ncbi:hypothetical protein BBJ28_00005958, partial [Nothophytophthora sp. Chile5]